MLQLPRLNARALPVIFAGVMGCLVPATAAWAEGPAGKDPKKEAGGAAPAGGEPSPPPLEPGADYLCQADVFYVWKPAPPAPEGVPTGAGNQAHLGAEPAEESGESRREFALVVGETGLVQDEVKNRVSSRIPIAQLEAVQKCKAEHEDRTSCVTMKIKRGMDNYTRLDFGARKAMLDAMNHDCENNLGVCGNSEVTEITCMVNRSPDAVLPKPVEAAAGGKGEGGKDAKKK